MKKIYFAMAVFCATAILFAGGAKDSASKTDKKSASVLKVGATPEPHAELLKLVIDNLKEEGITLEVVEFTDYLTPNDALESGQIDANYFQHLPYMNSFNKEKGYHLVSVGGIHIEPIALYSNTYKSLESIADGATVAIPNDPTNEGRALLLLQSAGLITLKDDAGLTATPLDVVANPKKLKFKELEAASIPRVLNDVGFAAINGNYAIAAGLSAVSDGLFVEGYDSPYVNVVSVKEGNEKDARIVALLKALQSKEVADYVAKRYPNGEVITVF